MAFATAADVAARLDQEFSEGEAQMAEYLTGVATAFIAEAASKDDEWAATVDPIPTVLKGLCVEITCRAMANPGQLQALTERLGAYTYTQNFRMGETGGIMLTPLEEQIVRRVVHGRTSDTAKVPSGFRDAEFLLWWERQQRAPLDSDAEPSYYW